MIMNSYWTCIIQLEKSENEYIYKFNNSIAKLYTKIYSHIHPNKKSNLLITLKHSMNPLVFFLGKRMRGT